MMTENSSLNTVRALAVAALCATVSTASASIVYDNSSSSLNRTYSPGNGIEFGDEVFFAGTDRVITIFKFETFTGASANNNQTAQIIFRLNDGPEISPGRNAPGTVLATSPLFNLGGAKDVPETHIWSDITVPVPANSFTWSVVLNGIEDGEQVGLSLYDPPTVGSSFSDFWQNTGTWDTFLFDNGVTPGNFAAQITAVAVPEPSTVALASIGGLALAGWMIRKRRG